MDESSFSRYQRLALVHFDAAQYTNLRQRKAARDDQILTL